MYPMLACTPRNLGVDLERPPTLLETHRVFLGSMADPQGVELTMEGPALGFPRPAISGLGSPADHVLAPAPGSVQEVETHNTKAAVNATEV